MSHRHEPKTQQRHEKAANELCHESEEGEVDDFLHDEAAYCKEYKPLAPWKRANIPDYGPLQDHHDVVFFCFVGFTCTLLYEMTDYFSKVQRWVAYLAIWFPLWFRLLARVSPALSDEEMDAKERREFHHKLQTIVERNDEVEH